MTLSQGVSAQRSSTVDFAPRALTSSLEAALSGPPGGVSDALARISSPADGEDLFLAYESVKSYVGPICGG